MHSFYGLFLEESIARFNLASRFETVLNFARHGGVIRFRH
jgi:hypothetical protein